MKLSFNLLLYLRVDCLGGIRRISLWLGLAAIYLHMRFRLAAILTILKACQFWQRKATGITVNAR